ncbi:MAG TPA: hypothetical protein VF507_07775 [Pyrinomonadaceae bacterium]|jgi:uncharacterized membrane protein YhdT
MTLSLLFILAQAETRYTQPGYFAPVVLATLVAGAVGWLVAAVLGFARARAFGASARWFSVAAVLLLLFHLQFLLLAFGLIVNNQELVFGLLSFFNVFVVLAAVCAIMGFVRLTNPR